MTEDPRRDDATSATPVAQGSRGRRGSSIWWVLAVAVLAIAIAAYVVSMHKTAPAERGMTPVSSPPTPTSIPSPTAPGVTKP